MHLWKFASISLFMALVSWAVSTGALAADDAEVRIVFFANMPEVEATAERPGLARVATYINQARQENPETFVFHGGDSLSPAVLSSLDQGAHMIDILNALEVDLMAVAKREFAYGEDILIQRAEEALFPFVSSNTLDKETQLPLDAVQMRELFDIGDISVGFVALTAPQVIREYATKRTIIRDSLEAALEHAAILRHQGADLIILNADFDLSHEAKIFTDGMFDLIIQVSAENVDLKKIENTFYLSELSSDTNLTDLKIALSPNGNAYGISSIEVGHPDLFALEPDPEVGLMVDGHVQPLKLLLETPLGRLAGPITTERNSVRSEENAFANMLADSVRIASNADVAIINGGSIRGNRRYEADTVLTRNDLQSELPFRNTVALLEVSGQQIWDALQYGLPCKHVLDGCFPHVSNIQLVYSNGDKTLTSVKIAGQQIDLERKYTLATTDFLSIGGDGYEVFTGAKRLIGPEDGQLTREILSKYIEDQQTIIPALERRIFFTD